MIICLEKEQVFGLDLSREFLPGVITCYFQDWKLFKSFANEGNCALNLPIEATP